MSFAESGSFQSFAAKLHDWHISGIRRENHGETWHATTHGNGISELCDGLQQVPNTSIF